MGTKVVDDKKLEKLTKKLKHVIDELDAQDETALRKTVVDAEEAIEKATTERNENAKYIAAKQVVSDLSLGLKDVKSYQGAKKTYCLYRLRTLRGET